MLQFVCFRSGVWWPGPSPASGCKVAKQGVVCGKKHAVDGTHRGHGSATNASHFTSSHPISPPSTAVLSRRLFLIRPFRLALHAHQSTTHCTASRPARHR